MDGGYSRRLGGCILQRRAGIVQFLPPALNLPAMFAGRQTWPQRTIRTNRFKSGMFPSRFSEGGIGRRCHNRG